MPKKDFYAKNKEGWADIHQSIFKGIIPNRTEWTKLEDIATILGIIAGKDNCNHMFLPDGGGMDLDGVVLSLTEPGCLELRSGGSSGYIPYVVKPKKLNFEAIDDGQDWNYFRLECDILEPSGIYKLSGGAYSEEVAELIPGKYINRGCLDSGEYNGKPLPAGVRGVVRILKGSIVIFKKASKYNGIRETYNAIHQQYGENDFRKVIVKACANFATAAVN